MRDQQRGSILIATMIVAILVATLCGSFLVLVTREHRLSNQSVQFNAASDLAEAGIEEAMWSINNKAITTTGGWTIIGNDAYQTFNANTTALTLDAIHKGELRVRIDGFGGSTPTVISEGRISSPSMPTIIKQVKVTIKASGGLYQGMTIANGIVFNNKPHIDSYDPTKGIYNATNNRGDKVNVISMAGNIQTNDAQIWGWIGVGTASSSGVGTSMNGGYLRNTSTVGNTTFDTKAITTGLKTNWPAVATPPDISTTGGTTLHVTQDTTVTLGDASSSTPSYYYYTDNGGTMNLSNNTVLKVNGPVVLVIQRGINMTGYAKILVDSNPNAKITIYASENINISGSNVLNDQPESSRLTVYGCGGAGQNIAISGSTTFTGVFNGPSWNVNCSGSLVWNGAMLASYANFSSGIAFHYDQSLGGSGTPKISSWQMLRDAANSGTSYARDNRTPFSN